jgi:hypothetical protein
LATRAVVSSGGVKGPWVAAGQGGWQAFRAGKRDPLNDFNACRKFIRPVVMLYMRFPLSLRNVEVQTAPLIAVLAGLVIRSCALNGR